MVKVLVALLLASASYAASLDEQIATLNAKADSLQREAWTLESQKLAVVLDTVALGDSTLAADRVRVVKVAGSPEWVKIALNRLTGDATPRLVWASLVGQTNAPVTLTGDSLLVRGDDAAKALPLISAALRE